ncbi:leucine carboxy methyltransferase [Kluyveromyces lactis]|uniref:Leucine carboxyl methyltransferase 1 n=1 Tax=Kluyveromyces lactis (strain ATCC 8585 / CBS 2359 / DSM 70799 / NBRC 1267 / NRRL Y-1140 / WM37) TaxID=284590 RepID=LCMT1_KLULA|nr:uncharacterized protein KLLA0_B01089g [Kluyveromyces lactis]Q6CWW0.1 RecName: Full=Leucine carboxyl methyltransferase 1; AltName: Full=Protein phosphatase methyltransferase 1; AltName: Full=[Phosphatase 2A protein]-leucine-carboxy methyltransferase 1 [Kluyveromyces lactis NRRL Y-1140]CAH01972.1 KLLA0B01089p [Kluyveromyces lactis]|eukprot:XP_451579.1 uncharacterized protein KLLA0_B01089g [Kluyveromyces lactis]
MERVIQETDNDAFSCKISAITKRYLPSSEQKKIGNYEHYEDIHLEFCKEIKSRSRRKYANITKACRHSLPVMNYGTYLRTVSIDLKLTQWLKNNLENPADKVQVINLGCGSDLRMMTFLASFPGVQWLDLDYKDVVTFKSTILRSNAKFRASLQIEGDLPEEPSSIENVITDRYQLLPCNVTDDEQLIPILKKYTDFSVPAVILTECVLCYLHESKASQLISTVTGLYKQGYWISYDPIGGSQTNDRFGSIMQDNLMESRQLSMPTLMVFNSEDKYKERFPGKSEIQTMWDYYQNHLEDSERQRLKTLQFLDEIEELQVIFSHYVICTTNWRI